MTAPGRQQKESRCTAVQPNPRARDLECRLMTAHSVHVDPLTSVRWAEGPFPRGWNRRWKKNYANRKLSRQSAVMARMGQKEKK